MESQKQAVRQKKELERRFKLKDGAEPSGEEAAAAVLAERDPDKHSDEDAGGSDLDEDEDRIGEEEIAGPPPPPPFLFFPFSWLGVITICCSHASPERHAIAGCSAAQMPFFCSPFLL